MTTTRDYYEVLGVARDAQEDEIKRSYRRLALRYHPDKNQGDKEAEERFKEISEAYAVLSDKEKRGRYDRFGHAGVSGSPGGGGWPGGGRVSVGDMDDARRLFEQIFGGMGGGAGGGGGFGSLFGDVLFGGGGRGGVERGESLEMRLDLDFTEALFGVEKPLEFRRAEPCDECAGSGVERGKRETPCATCKGHGQVRRRVASFFGETLTIGPCPACQGRGKSGPPCGTCRGEGRVAGKRRLSVRIPSGVEDGMVLRVRGEGEAGPRGGPPGDLLVHLRVKPHPIFRREGDAVGCDLPVSFTTLALGAEAEVPTPDGKRSTIKIKPGTPTGTVLRIRPEKGPPVLVRLTVVVPKRVTAEQAEILRRLEATGIDEKISGFWEKFRSLFS